MGYRQISCGHITDPAVRLIFHRADLYIGDVYSMFYLPYVLALFIVAGLN